MPSPESRVPSAELRTPILAAPALAVLAYLAVTRVAWPWFSIWLILLTALAVLWGGRVTRRGGPVHQGTAWLLVLGGVALFNIHLYYIQTQRQRSERLDLPGVYLHPGPEGVTLGVGEPALDVSLAGSLVELDRWSLRVRRSADGFVVDRLSGVDWLEQRRRRIPDAVERWTAQIGRRQNWVPRWGAELSRERPVLRVRDATGAVRELRLHPDGRRGELEWSGERVSLSRTSPVLDARLVRRMRSGVPLAELGWRRLPDTSAGDDLVLSLVHDAWHLGVFTPRWPKYRVASRGARWRVEQDGSTRDGDGTSLALTARDTVRVASRGKTWMFALEDFVTSEWGAPAVQVTFVQRPTPRGWPLPSPEDCRAQRACAVVSSHRLPPPVVHFDLSGFGLDTARWALLGRLDRVADSMRFVTDARVYEVPFARAIAIQASPLVASAPPAGILLRVHRAEAGAWLDVAITLALLGSLMLGVAIALRASPYFRTRLAAQNPHAGAAWLLIRLVTVFLGLRLVLGLRVTYAAPYYDRGADTATGLWIATALVAVIFGYWPSVWGMVVRAAEWAGRLRASVGRRRSAAREEVLPPATARDSGLPTHDAGLGLTIGAGVPAPGAGAPADPWRAFALLVVALIGCGIQRPGALLGGIGVAVLVMLAWVAVAFIGVNADPARLRNDPFAIVTADPNAERTALPALAVTALLAAALVLASQSPGYALALLLVLGCTSLLFRALRIHRRSSLTQGLVFGAMGAVAAATFAPRPLSVVSVTLLAAGVLASSVALVWARGRLAGDPGLARSVGSAGLVVLLVCAAQMLGFLQGPMLLFGLVFMLFLLAVRAGVLYWNRLGAATTAPAPATQAAPGSRRWLLLVLLIPILALLPYVAVDFGLGLVVFVPIFLTVLLAAGAGRLGVLPSAGALALILVVGLTSWSVLFPSTAAVERPAPVAERAAAFDELGGGVARLAQQIPNARVAVRRATVRSLAARRPDLLERLLVQVGPSEAREELIPAIEQTWGGRAYSAAGWTGAGLAGTTMFGRGISAATSYAENAFAVYVLSEHGALGGLTVLAMYLALAGALLWWVWRARRTSGDTSRRNAVVAAVIGGGLLIVLPAGYVALSNLGAVPLTGQNMPFLGLNAWSDVVFVTALTSAMVAALFESAARA